MIESLAVILASYGDICPNEGISMFMHEAGMIVQERIIW